MFWILTFFPSVLVHLILVAGLLLFLGASVLGMIPIINQYKLPVHLIGFLLAAIGLFYEGGIAYKDSQSKEVSELQLKLAKAEATSAERNTQIQANHDKDVKIIHEKGQSIIRYLQTDGKKYDDQCVIPSDIVDAHNRAATLTVTPSDPKADNIILSPRTTP